MAKKPVDKSSKAYRDGQQASAEGRPSSDNPYPSQAGLNHDRYLWFMGFYDRRLQRFDAIPEYVSPEHAEAKEAEKQELTECSSK